MTITITMYKLGNKNVVVLVYNILNEIYRFYENSALCEILVMRIHQLDFFYLVSYNIWLVGLYLMLNIDVAAGQIFICFNAKSNVNKH